MANDTELTLAAVELASLEGGLHTGFSIATQFPRGAPPNGVQFSVVSVQREEGTQDKPIIVLKADYLQRIKLAELNLDLRCSQLAPGTCVGVQSSDERFEIPHQQLAGDLLVGRTVKKVNGLSIHITLRIECPAPHGPAKAAEISLEFASVDDPQKAPSAKKMKAPSSKKILQKILIKLPS